MTRLTSERIVRTLFVVAISLIATLAYAADPDW